MVGAPQAHALDGWILRGRDSNLQPLPNVILHKYCYDCRLHFTRLYRRQPFPFANIRRSHSNRVLELLDRVHGDAREEPVPEKRVVQHRDVRFVRTERVRKRVGKLAHAEGAQHREGHGDEGPVARGEDLADK